MDCYNVVIHVDTSFLQMFLWERFRAPASKPIEFLMTVSSEVVGANGSWMRKTMFKARALQCASMTRSANKSLAKVIDKEDTYNFRP